MTTLDKLGLETETRYFMARMRELTTADHSGDPVGLYEALDDIRMIALHAEFPKIKARALAELDRRGWNSEQFAGL